MADTAVAATIGRRDTDNQSPHQLSYDLHPFLSAIETIAAEHGLQHDSGVSIVSVASGSTRPGTQKPARRERIEPPLAAIDQHNEASSSKNPASTYEEQASVSHAKRVSESPGVLGDLDARDDTWGDVGRRLKPFGDTLRHERLRSQLADSALAQNCVSLLNYSLDAPQDSHALADAQIEMLRILANLCIDNKENREKLLQIAAPQSVVHFIDRTLSTDASYLDPNTLQLLRTAVGALLNLQLDCQATHEALRGDVAKVDVLLRLASDDRVYHVGNWYRRHTDKAPLDAVDWKKSVVTGASITTWAWRIVQDVCAGEGKDDEGQAGKAKDAQDDDEKTIESLVEVGAVKVIESLLRPLRSLVRSTQSSSSEGAWDGDDVCDRMEADVDILQICAELIELCSFDSNAFRIAALKTSDANLDEARRTPLLFLLDFLETAKMPAAWSIDENKRGVDLPPAASDPEVVKEVEANYARVKAAIARAIVGIVAEDDNMTNLFEGGWFIDRMKAWMLKDSKANDDLVSTAMLAVGNLARKDSHCMALVHEHDLVPTLTSTLAPTADIRVTHGVICLLKNLAIPATNKQVIGTSNDLIARLAPFLEKDMDKVQPLQFAAVGLLKHLCGGCLVNAQNFVLSPTKSSLLALLSRTDDVPTRMEGTRVLVNAIKTMWSTKSDAVTSDKQQVEQRKLARQELCIEPVILAISEMVKGSTKYPVLVNEGILSLTLVASQPSYEGLSSGAILVAKALQTLRPSRKASSLSDRNAAAPPPPKVDSDDTAATAAAGAAAAIAATAADAVAAAAAAGDKAVAASPPPPRLPQRQTTLDALASTTNQALPTPRTGADMIATVLLRRDARMPPQFANNACTLIQTLVSTTTAAQDSDSDRAFIVHLLNAWRSSLEQLGRIGPQETIPLAQRALRSVQQLLQK